MNLALHPYVRRVLTLGRLSLRCKCSTALTLTWLCLDKIAARNMYVPISGGVWVRLRALGDAVLESLALSG